MKQVYQADWERVREKFNNLNLLDAETLSKLDGFWGEAFTTNLSSLSSVIIVKGFPDGIIDVSLKASSEEEAEALLSALEKEREYFFAFVPTYPWRDVIERKLSGSYVGKQIHYKVSKENFKPQIKHKVIKLNEEHRSIIKGYPDEDIEFGEQSYAQFDCALQYGYPFFASVAKEKIVSVCCTMGNSINWVHTLEPFRNKGYGKSVVSVAVMDILQKEDEATYDADDYKIASTKLCKSLGFTPYYETLYFVGRPIS
jgi:hypothetical protein